VKAEFKIPPEFIEEIVERLYNRLKPCLSDSGKREVDVIFDVEGLAQYLKVEPSWVYNQVSQKSLPYFKTGKYVRFRKKEIDVWINSQIVKPISPLNVLSMDKKGR
jgi:excisionase family DNA binding protein